MTFSMLTCEMMAYRVGHAGIIQLAESRPPVMQCCLLGSLNRVHASKRRTMLQKLESNHTEGVHVHFEVVGLMSEHLWSHVTVRACFACQPEL